MVLFGTRRVRRGDRSRWPRCGARCGRRRCGARLAARSAGAPFCAASMSAFTIRPLGPEPFNAERSMPACLAMRRASGETKILSPRYPGHCPTGAAKVLARLRGCRRCVRHGGGRARLSGFLLRRFLLGRRLRLLGFPLLGGLGGWAPAGTSSPSSTRMAIGSFTFTPAVPSPTRILPSTPSSTASTSIVALSVSISAMTSPAWTGSPSFFSQRASVPSVIVGLSAGIRMLVGISSSFHARAALAPLPLAALPLRRSS